jgi:hypothetical protein
MKIYKISGNGDCLFGACAYHLKTTSVKLRRKVADIIQKYPNLPINGIKLKDWIKWSNESIKSYHTKIRKGKWGSAIELSLIAIMYRRTIRVYQRQKGKFKKITEVFPEFGNSFCIHYSGNHYDSLIK